MGVLIISLILSLLVLIVSARSLVVEQTLSQLLVAMIAGIWAYSTLMVMLYFITTQWEVLLFAGLLPVIVVGYGFRYYEQKQKLKKEKHKRDESE